jgi:micrococcal nuclease
MASCGVNIYPPMLKRFSLLFIAFFLILTLTGCVSNVSSTTVHVIHVIDGDTIIIEGDIRVRYIGIDTPEMLLEPEPFAIDATEANRTLVEGKMIRLEKDVSETDKYGRLLRYVYVDDTFVNAELVRLGYAVVKAYPPDTKYQRLLEQMETEAKDDQRGLWAK